MDVEQGPKCKRLCSKADGNYRDMQRALVCQTQNVLGLSPWNKMCLERVDKWARWPASKGRGTRTEEIGADEA